MFKVRVGLLLLLCFGLPIAAISIISSAANDKSWPVVEAQVLTSIARCEVTNLGWGRRRRGPTDEINCDLLNRYKAEEPGWIIGVRRHYIGEVALVYEGKPLVAYMQLPMFEGDVGPNIGDIIKVRPNPDSPTDIVSVELAEKQSFAGYVVGGIAVTLLGLAAVVVAAFV